MRLAFALAVSLAASTTSAQETVSVAGAREFRQQLYAHYRADPSYTLSWFRITEKEVLRANRVRQVRGPAKLLFPDVVDILLSHGARPVLRPELELLSHALHSLCSVPDIAEFLKSEPESSPHKQGIDLLTSALSQVSQARNSLTAKIEAADRKAILEQLGHVERGLATFIDPKTDLDIGHDKVFVKIERSLVRALALLGALR